jgi:hypothetical protein
MTTEDATAPPRKCCGLGYQSPWGMCADCPTATPAPVEVAPKDALTKLAEDAMRNGSIHRHVAAPVEVADMLADVQSFYTFWDEMPIAGVADKVARIKSGIERLAAEKASAWECMDGPTKRVYDQRAQFLARAYEAEARAEAAERDAERYRWMRDYGGIRAFGRAWPVEDAAKLDAEVDRWTDAARAPKDA